jgi:hypothetical protein
MAGAERSDELRKAKTVSIFRRGLNTPVLDVGFEATLLQQFYWILR